MVLQFTWKKDYLFARGLSLENSADSYLCFPLVLLHPVPYFFFFYWSPSSLCKAFDSISSNINEVLSINTIWLSFIMGLDNLFWWNWQTWELCYNLSVPNDLTQMVNFPTRIPDCDSQSCSSGFISSDASICSTMAYPPLVNSDHVAVLFYHVDVPTHSKQDSLFHRIVS